MTSTLPERTADTTWIADRSTPVLVTGAAGFVGSRVVAALLRMGFEQVRCAVRRSSDLGLLQAGIPRELANRGEIVEANLLSPDDCNRVAAGAELVYHLVAGRGKSYPACLSRFGDLDAKPARRAGRTRAAEAVREREFVRGLLELRYSGGAVSGMKAARWRPTWRSATMPTRTASSSRTNWYTTTTTASAYPSPSSGRGLSSDQARRPSRALSASTPSASSCTWAGGRWSR